MYWFCVWYYSKHSTHRLAFTSENLSGCLTYISDRVNRRTVGENESNFSHTHRSILISRVGDDCMTRIFKYHHISSSDLVGITINTETLLHNPPDCNSLGMLCEDRLDFSVIVSTLPNTPKLMLNTCGAEMTTVLTDHYKSRDDALINALRNCC